MAYRLPSARAPVEIEDGPTVEVCSIGAWPIYRTAVGLVSAFLAAKPAAEAAALRELYTFFVAEAQPTWEIVDHRGPVLPTADGMLRLPVIDIALKIIDGWVSTFQPVPEATAVDAMIPPGPLRDELNRGLRRSKKAD
jgi:hypothetical protein